MGGIELSLGQRQTCYRSSSGQNAYIFHIPSPSLHRRILQHELWRVGDSPFFVTEWKSEFSLNPPSLDRAPVWAKINGIPFDLITDESLSVIFSSLGRVVDAKPFTSISSAEVKVIVDLTKPLPPELELECEDAKENASSDGPAGNGGNVPIGNGEEGWKNVQSKKKHKKSKSKGKAIHPTYYVLVPSNGATKHSQDVNSNQKPSKDKEIIQFENKLAASSSGSGPSPPDIDPPARSPTNKNFSVSAPMNLILSPVAVKTLASDPSP
ncbi:hypothetical protein YC2023_077266 [Brassica napus]